MFETKGKSTTGSSVDAPVLPVPGPSLTDQFSVEVSTTDLLSETKTKGETLYPCYAHGGSILNSPLMHSLKYILQLNLELIIIKTKKD